MVVEKVLSERINLPQIRDIIAMTRECPELKNELWHLAHSENRRTAVNALWVMSHMTETEGEWLQSLQPEMIDMLIPAQDEAKKRILLQLLREQEHTEENFRDDLLDYCFSKINAECEPYAVRCFCMYVAFKICRPFPELIAELEQHLELLTMQDLSPGLKSALRQTTKKVERLKKEHVQPE